MSTNAPEAVKDNPLIDWLKQLRRDAKALIAFILNALSIDPSLQAVSDEGVRSQLTMMSGGVHRLTFSGTSSPKLRSGVNVPDCTSFVASHSDVWNQGSAYIVAAGLLSD